MNQAQHLPECDNGGDFGWTCPAACPVNGQTTWTDPARWTPPENVKTPELDPGAPPAGWSAHLVVQQRLRPGEAVFHQTVLYSGMGHADAEAAIRDLVARMTGGTE